MRGKENNREIKNGRVGVHFIKSGFSLIELITVMAILMLAAPMTLIAAYRPDEQETAIIEAKNLADWLEMAFIRSDATKRRFSIISSNALSPRLYISWISASSVKNEIYDSGGRALFTVPSGGDSNYNPLAGYLESQLGMTILVYGGSDTGRGKIIRYVVISRFGRVRVSAFPPP